MITKHKTNVGTSFQYISQPAGREFYNNFPPNTTLKSNSNYIYQFIDNTDFTIIYN